MPGWGPSMANGIKFSFNPKVEGQYPAAGQLVEGEGTLPRSALLFYLHFHWIRQGPLPLEGQSALLTLLIQMLIS